MTKFSHTVTQFNDYLYYWHITTPFGSITAEHGKKTREASKEELEMVVAKIYEDVIGLHEPVVIVAVPEYKPGDYSEQIGTL